MFNSSLQSDTKLILIVFIHIQRVRCRVAWSIREVSIGSTYNSYSNSFKPTSFSPLNESVEGSNNDFLRQMRSYTFNNALNSNANNSYGFFNSSFPNPFAEKSNKGKSSAEKTGEFHEIRPDMTEEDLEKFKNPFMAKLAMLDLKNREEIMAADLQTHNRKLLTNEFKWAANHVFLADSDAKYKARRNRMGDGLKILFGAFSAINWGVSTLGSSWAKGLGSFISWLSGMYRGLESGLNESIYKVSLIKPSDYDLMQLIGRDTIGRTVQEHKLDYLKGQPSFSMSLSTLLSETSSLGVSALSGSSASTGGGSVGQSAQQSIYRS